jgi:tetratricopeptide (TPR) repeat protein
VVPAIEQSILIGNAYYAQNQPERALQSYLTGLILLGEGPPGPEGERLLRSFGRGVTRQALLRELEVESVARGPQFKGIHLAIHHGLGLAYLQQAQNALLRGDRRVALPLIARAIPEFEEALKIAPSYLLSHRKMALACELKGDNSAAIDWLRKAADLWPDDVITRLDLAEALFNNGEFREALRHLDEVRASNSALTGRQLAQIMVNRGLIFERGMNEPGRALYCYEKGLELDPAYPEVDNLKAAILHLRAAGLQPLPDDLYDKPKPPRALREFPTRGPLDGPKSLRVRRLSLRPVYTLTAWPAAPGQPTALRARASGSISGSSISSWVLTRGRPRPSGASSMVTWRTLASCSRRSPGLPR